MPAPLAALYGALQLKKEYHGTAPKFGPGEKHAPILGNYRKPPPGFRPFMDLYGVGERSKMGSVQMSSFVDELQKIATTGTEQDNSGILRALLKSLVGAPPVLPSSYDTQDSYNLMERQLLFGGDDGRANYAQRAQETLAQKMLMDTRLQAVSQGMSGPSMRSI